MTTTLERSHTSRQSDWRSRPPGGSAACSRATWAAWSVRGFFSACPQQQPRHTVTVQPAALAAVPPLALVVAARFTVSAPR